MSLECSKEPEHDGIGGPGCGRRTNKKRWTGTRSPGTSGRRGAAKQPVAQKTRGRAAPPRPPLNLHDRQEQLQEEVCLEEETQDDMLHVRAQGSGPSVLMEGMTQ